MSSLKSSLNEGMKELERFAQTEVMPANAPLINRVGVSSSFPFLVKNYPWFYLSNSKSKWTTDLF